MIKELIAKYELKIAMYDNEIRVLKSQFDDLRSKKDYHDALLKKFEIEVYEVRKESMESFIDDLNNLSHK